MDPFVALADPIRRDLLRRLGQGPARVVELAAPYAVSRPAISRHLRLLTEAGLCTARDSGRERHYRLEPAGLAPVARFVADLTGLADPPALADPAGAAEPTGREPATPPIPEDALAGLDLEVRRTVRDQTATTRHEETA